MGRRDARPDTPISFLMLILTAGKQLQITLRGILFLTLGEFAEFYEAIYHSAVYCSLKILLHSHVDMVAGSP
jgi:hypothetical protein